MVSNHRSRDLQPRPRTRSGKWTLLIPVMHGPSREYSIVLLSGIFILISKPREKRKKGENSAASDMTKGPFRAIERCSGGGRGVRKYIYASIPVDCNID